ncbi:MAG: AMP phosphorylase [Haloarculaceae archaeon]
MNFQAVPIDLGTHAPTVVLNAADAAELGVNPLDRVQIDLDGRTTVGIVEVTEGLVDEGSLGATRRVGHLRGEVDVRPAPRPDAVRFIRKKLADVELDPHELERIVHDIDESRLSDVELSAYVCSVQANGLSLEETKHLTVAMTDAGDTIEWDRPVVADKHSIGGVPGNRVTPVVVPIVAAAGVTIPKTSSRAVTSPAGTADTMEVLCDVEFDIEEIRAIVEETNGCMVWGGAVSLSPVDDKIIRAETPLSLDPAGQVIASVLSKKRSAGSTHVLIDVPYGEGSKVGSLPDARELAEDFRRVGEHLGLGIECTITSGDAPIGRGIGPVLEARDVLRVLEGGGPEELRLKSLRFADILLESCQVDADAEAILEDGRALAKFREIVAAQDGDPDVAPGDLAPGEERVVVTAARGGVVTHVDNQLVSEIARRAGAPRDAAAGIYLERAVDDEVVEGDTLFTIHARSADKLSDARSLASRTEPIRVRRPAEMLVERA